MLEKFPYRLSVARYDDFEEMKKRSLFGLVQLKSHFAYCPPLFKNILVNYKDISELIEWCLEGRARCH